MTISRSRIAQFEWANYAATCQVAQVTPGLEVIMNENVIITSSTALPIPDANHACLLRAGAGDIEPLLDQVVDHFASRSMPTTVYLSQACTPGDLVQRLLERDFVAQEPREAWMVIDPIKVQRERSPVAVREVTSGELPRMAELFMASFGMPTEFAPVMAQLLKPSLGLDGVHHYMAWLGEKAIGVCSLHQYQHFGVLGSAGVLPAYRGKGAATALATTALCDARQAGIDTVMLQTDDGTPLQRLLRINGFSTLFVRTAYTKP